MWMDLPKVGTEFDLALNGQQYTTSQTPFNYSFAVDTFYVTQITPKFAPGTSKARTLLNMTGHGFDNTGEISCKFLAIFNPAQPAFVAETEATYFSPTSVTCWTPYFTDAEWSALMAKGVAVDISLNAQNYRSDIDNTFLYRTTTFYTANPPVNVTPSSGPSSGATSVEIGVTHRHTNEYLSYPHCRWSYRDDTLPFDVNRASFGVRYFITQAQATKGGGSVSCSAPSKSEDLAFIQAQPLPMKVAIDITYNGQNYEATPVNYTFYPASEVISISPTFGLAAADYKVTITGNNFAGGNTIRVKFGDALVRSAVLESPTTIVVDPPLGQALGEVHVYISLNGQDWIDSCKKTYGETSDHVILHGTCNTFTWSEDPVCYTCQTPLKPASVENAASSGKPNPLIALLFVAVAFMQSFGAM